MASLSSPAPFGDCEAPTIEQDANSYLEATLRAIRIEHGQHLRDMAGEVLGILSADDGMSRTYLQAAVEETLDIRQISYASSAITRAIRELVKRGVLNDHDDVLSLNPAVAALIGRDA